MTATVDHRTIADPPTVAPLRTDGLLEIDLAPRADGRTGVARLVQRFPQRVTTPMHLDPEVPGAVHLCVQNPTGGLFGGDRLHTRVHLAPGTALALGDQSTTQVHPGGVASARYAFAVEDTAVLEHVPRPLTPHRDAVLVQDTVVDLHGDAVYLGWEALAAGRVGHGERFAFGSATLRTRVCHDGVPLVRESLALVPDRADPRAVGVLADADYVASMLVLAPRRDAALEGLAAHLTAVLTGRPGAGGAASPLPDGVGVTVRVLATRAPALHSALRAVWSAARAALLGRHRLPERI